MQQVPTAEINQCHVQGVCVHYQVLQFDVSMKNSAAAAFVSSFNDLLHHMPCELFVEDAPTALQKDGEILTGRGALQDHNIMVRELLPIQQLNDVG